MVTLYEVSKLALELAALVVTVLALMVSYAGYSKTKKSVFARLSLAFIGLSVNFFLNLLADSLFMFEVIEDLYYIKLIASFFEMVGFFFLAFSHMVKVYQEKRFVVAPLIIFNLNAAFKTLSIYFIFYATLETMITYSRSKSRIVLSTAIGLLGFATYSILSWIAEFVVDPTIYQVFSLIFQVFGILAFFVPIWIYYRGVKT
ncbi:MAG: hypothetical protein QXJ17_01325 [Nitrososphaeria archaeon]